MANEHSPYWDSTKKELIDILEGQMRQYARRLDSVHYSEVLMEQMQISREGVDLIHWIANSSCRNNHEALKFWIMQCANDPYFNRDLFPIDELEMLTLVLRRRMEIMEASIPC